MAKKESLTNFIPISRRLFEHHLWCEEREFSRFEAWIYLLKEARFEDTKLYDGNKVVDVKRGQVYASIRFFAKAWRWSPKKVLGYLDLLINDNMIVKETLKETGQSLITICKYEEYNTVSENGKQQRKQQGNSKETKSNTVNTENNVIPPTIPQQGDLFEEENNNIPVEMKNDKTWRDDFEIYKKEALAGYLSVCDNKIFIEERQKFHPNLDISLSLEKAYRDYWATERAWVKRKKGKTDTFNWVSTYKNSLTQKFNQVYLQKNTFNQQNNEQTQKTGSASGFKLVR